MYRIQMTKKHKKKLKEGKVGLLKFAGSVYLHRTISIQSPAGTRRLPMQAPTLRQDLRQPEERQ